MDEILIVAFGMFMAFVAPLGTAVGSLILALNVQRRVKTMEEQLAVLNDRLGQGHYVAEIPNRKPVESGPIAAVEPLSVEASKPEVSQPEIHNEVSPVSTPDIVASRDDSKVEQASSRASASVYNGAEVTPEPSHVTVEAKRPGDSRLCEGEATWSRPAVCAEKSSSGVHESAVERLFLGNLFNKIGAVAIIISVALLVRLTTPYLLATPELKIGAGYLAGVILLALGAVLHGRPGLGAFAEVLLGTGFGAAFIATYCSCTLFSVFSVGTAMGIASVLLIAVYGLAMYMKRLSLLCLALLAGYANVWFINPFVSSDFLCGYLLLLNLLALAGARRCEIWIYALNINLALTLGTLVGSTSSDDNTYRIALVGLLWAVYAIFDILRDRSDNVRFARESAYCYICFLLLGGFSVVMFYEETSVLGVLLVSLGMGYCCVSSILKDDMMVRSYLNTGLFCLMIGIFFGCSNEIRVYALAGFAVLLAIAGARFKPYEKQEAWTIAFLVASSLSIMGVDVDYLLVPGAGDYSLSCLSPVVYGVPAFCWLACYYLLSDEQVVRSSACELCYFSFVGMIYLWGFAELQSWQNAHTLGLTGAQGRAIRLLCSVSWALLFAAQAIIRYSKSKKVYEAVASYVVYALCSVVLVAMCLEGLSNPLVPLVNIRFLSIALAIFVAYTYRRITGSEHFCVLMVAWGFLLVHAEAVGLASLLQLKSITTICWVLYAAGIIIPGISSHKKYLTYSGIVIVMASVLRVVVYDMAALSGVYKLAVFLVMGITLMVISYLYSSYRQRLADEPGKHD